MSIASKKSLQPLMYVLAYWPTLRSGSITKKISNVKQNMKSIENILSALGLAVRLNSLGSGCKASPNNGQCQAQDP
jgi:hypothetical protein